MQTVEFDEKVLNNILKKTIERWTKSTESKMKKILIKNNKGDSRLIKNLKIRAIFQKNAVILETGLPDYAIYVDQGRLPGKQPPMSALDKWMVRKGIAPRNKKGEFLPRKSIQFLIARSIGENGIKATHFMEPLKEYSKLMSEIGNLTAIEIGSLLAQQINKK